MDDSSIIAELIALSDEATAQEREIELAHQVGAPLGPILEGYYQEALHEYSSNIGTGGVDGRTKGNGSTESLKPVDDGGPHSQQTADDPTEAGNNAGAGDEGG